MKEVLRKIVAEIIWLAVSFGLAVLLSWVLVGKNMLSDSIDIHLHDTYYVIVPLYFLLPIFILITFVVYFIKEFRHSFQRAFPNWIFVITGSVLLISLTFLIQLFSQNFNIAWTEYPPLSSTGVSITPELTPDPVAKFITNILMLLQFLILISLLYVVFRWGTHNQRKNDRPL